MLILKNLTFNSFLKTVSSLQKRQFFATKGLPKNIWTKKTSKAGLCPWRIFEKQSAVKTILIFETSKEFLSSLKNIFLPLYWSLGRLDKFGPRQEKQFLFDKIWSLLTFCWNKIRKGIVFIIFWKMVLKVMNEIWYLKYCDKDFTNWFCFTKLLKSLVNKQFLIQI